MPGYARSMDKTWSTTGTSLRSMDSIIIRSVNESDWRSLAKQINNHLMEKKDVDDRSKKEILGNSMVAVVIAACVASVFLVIGCIGLMTGLFIELGAAYGGIANILWVSGFLYFCYRVFLKIVAALRRLELLQYLSQEEKKKLLEEEMARIKEERELEALRKKSKLPIAKIETKGRKKGEE